MIIDPKSPEISRINGLIAYNTRQVFSKVLKGDIEKAKAQINHIFELEHDLLAARLDALKVVEAA